MGTRSEVFKDGIDAGNGGNVEWWRGRMTDNVAFHAPGAGLDLVGADAVIEALEKFVADEAPRHTLATDPIEHGDFVVAFSELERTVGGRQSRAQVCHVTRWEGDRVAEYWSMRHAAR
jgi:hypothetical protein